MKNKYRVSHYPQIPCNPFYVDVQSLEEAHLICKTLASYDSFQLENNIKPDYCNMNFVEVWNENQTTWDTWMDEETGIDNIYEYFKEKENEKNINL